MRAVESKPASVRRDQGGRDPGFMSKRKAPINSKAPVTTRHTQPVAAKGIEPYRDIFSSDPKGRAEQLAAENCGRGDLNSHGPFDPTDFHTTSAFAATRIGCSWSGLSLHHGIAALGAARLASTPSHCWAWLGITSEGFPDFGQFYSRCFHRGTQFLKSGASTIPPRPQDFCISQLRKKTTDRYYRSSSG